VAWLPAWNTPFSRLIKCVVPGLGAWAFALRRQRSHVRIVSGAPVPLYFSARYARSNQESHSVLFE